MQELQDTAARGRPTEFDIFISYAHADDEGGFVRALRDEVDAAFRRDGRAVSIFFDRESIRIGSLWDARIKQGLLHSAVMLVCESPNYWASEFCRREWTTFMSRELTDSQQIASVWLVDVPQTGAPEGSWRRTLSAIQASDLRHVFREGAPALAAAGVSSVKEALWNGLEKAAAGIDVPGNLKRHNDRFVGREYEVEQLYTSVLAAPSRTVTVIAGLGGMGKTELAVRFCTMYRHRLSAIWQLKAEGATSLWSVLGQLASHPLLADHLRLRGNETPEDRGRAVRDAIHAQATGGKPVVLFLDNVDQPALLKRSIVDELPNDGSIRVIVTTRLGRDELKSAAVTDVVSCGPLSEEEALNLIEKLQPKRGDDFQGSFADDSERVAALNVVRQLEGWTLAVELVAIYLGQPYRQSVRNAVMELREAGLAHLEEAADEVVTHQSGLLDVVLGQTMDDLSPEAREILVFAALMPPDTVRLDWLRELVGQSFPKLVKEHLSDWALALHTLQGRNLLAAGQEEHTARMHRLVGECVRRQERAGLEKRAEVMLALLQREQRRADGDIELETEAASPMWELGKVLKDAHPELAQRVYSAALETWRKRMWAFAGHMEVDHEYGLLLGDLAAVLERTNPEAARLAFSEWVQIAWENETEGPYPRSCRAQRDALFGLSRVMLDTRPDVSRGAALQAQVLARYLCTLTDSEDEVGEDAIGLEEVEDWCAARLADDSWPEQTILGQSVLLSSPDEWDRLRPYLWFTDEEEPPAFFVRPSLLGRLFKFGQDAPAALRGVAKHDEELMFRCFNAHFGVCGVKLDGEKQQVALQALAAAHTVPVVAAEFVPSSTGSVMRVWECDQEGRVRTRVCDAPQPDDEAFLEWFFGLNWGLEDENAPSDSPPPAHAAWRVVTPAERYEERQRALRTAMFHDEAAEFAEIHGDRTPTSTRLDPDSFEWPAIPPNTTLAGVDELPLCRVIGHGPGGSATAYELFLDVTEPAVRYGWHQEYLCRVDGRPAMRDFVLADGTRLNLGPNQRGGEWYWWILKEDAFWARVDAERPAPLAPGAGRTVQAAGRAFAEAAELQAWLDEALAGSAIQLVALELDGHAFELAHKQAVTAQIHRWPGGDQDVDDIQKGESIHPYTMTIEPWLNPDIWHFRNRDNLPSLDARAKDGKVVAFTAQGALRPEQTTPYLLTSGATENLETLWWVISLVGTDTAVLVPRHRTVMSLTVSEGRDKVEFGVQSSDFCFEKALAQRLEREARREDVAGGVYAPAR